MRPSHRPHPSPFAWPVLVLIAAPAVAADPAATLAGKGLTKSGVVYVVPGEKALAARWKEAKTTLNAHQAGVDRQEREAEIATRRTDLEEQRLAGQDRLAELNQQILEETVAQSRGGPGSGPMGNGPASPLVFERDQLRRQLAGVSAEQSRLRTQAAPVPDRAGVDEAARTRAEQARKAVAELKTLAAEVDQAYARLGADPEVRAALAEQARATKAPIRLGPSDTHRSVARAIEQADRKLNGSAAPEGTKSAKRKKAKARL